MSGIKPPWPAMAVRKCRTALFFAAAGLTVLSMLSPALSTGCSGPPPTATPTTAPPTATPTTAPPTATPAAAATQVVAVTPVVGSDCGDWQRAAASTAYPVLAPNDVYRVCGDELHVLIIEADHDRLAVYPSGN